MEEPHPKALSKSPICSTPLRGKGRRQDMNDSFPSTPVSFQKLRILQDEIRAGSLSFSEASDKVAIISSSLMANQSFPVRPSTRVHRRKSRTPVHVGNGGEANLRKWVLQTLTQNEHSFDLSANSNVDHFLEDSSNFTANSDHNNSRGSNSSFEDISQFAMNPNKGIFCLDQSGVVLTLSKKACEMLGYFEGEIIGKKLTDLVVHDKRISAAEEMECLANQTCIPVSGRVTDMKRADGSVATVSLWQQEVDGESRRKVVLMEEVQKNTGELILSRKGKILKIDENAKKLFHLDLPSSAEITIISELIPKFDTHTIDKCDLEKTIITSQLSGKTASGTIFPLGARLEQISDLEFRLKIWSFRNVSGLVIIEGNGTICACNEMVAFLLFGYFPSDIEGKPVTFLIPHFYEEVDILQRLSLSLMADLSLSPKCEEKAHGDSLVSLPDGQFVGQGKHKDGTLVDVSFEIKKTELEDNSSVYCIWMSKCERPRITDDSDFSLSFANDSREEKELGDISLGQNVKKLAEKANKEKEHHDESLNDNTLSLCEGPFAEQYEVLSQLGKGAFGSVKTGYDRKSRKMVVVKFVKKSKILKEQWMIDVDGRNVPLEVCFLLSLSHPNVVSLVDVFENDIFYQLIMEKHGSGMDLFEFVDRKPKMDDPLIAYIFHQVVEAVAYLHGKNILHRDIKDENIIINEHFAVKLIDFGSATIFQPGQLFRTFYGTIEYCSPEVFCGNPYEGPPLEMWALGVLLYILVFLENPFYTLEETIKCKLIFPRRERNKVSKQCIKLIEAILVKDPKLRLSLTELQLNDWLNQPVDINSYSIQDVVPCNEEEVNPAYYYFKTDSHDKDAIPFISNKTI